MHKQYDGWASNHGDSEQDLGSEEVDAFRAALSWEITDRLYLDYGYDRTESDLVPTPLQITAVSEGATDGSLLGTYDIAKAQFYSYNALIAMQDVVETDGRVEDFNLDGQGTEKVEIQGHNLTLTFELDNVTFKSISSYREYDSDFLSGNDLDGGSWSFEGEALPVFHTDNIKEQDQFQQELQALGTAFDAKLDYVVGLYYFEEQGREDNPWFTTLYQSDQPVLLRGIPLGSYYGIDNESLAAFGNFTYRPSDAWYAVLGLRYTEDKKAMELNVTDPRLTEARRFDDKWEEFTPAFTIGYQPSDELNVYFKYAEGFNAGVFGIPTDPTAETIVPADPEELNTFELGLKSEWLDRTLRVNAAAFFTDADNLQVTAFVEGNRTVINSGSAEIYGGEIETVYMPNANWIIDANYGYRKTERDALSDVADPSGKHSGRVGLGYNLPAGDFGLFSARMDASYKDSIEYTSNGSADVDSRWLLSARAGVSEIELGKGELRFAVWGKNLADEEYGVHGTDFGLESGYGFAGVVYGQPRSYGVDLIWEF
jgi:iron complex outermembrane receptor protein